MPKFGKKSLDILSTCHTDIQIVMSYAIKHGPDFSIISGYRGVFEQNRLFRDKKSKKRYPNSKHNFDLNGIACSKAVDIAPYPIDWKDRDRFILVAGWILQSARILDIPMRWGGDWNRNWIIKDNWNDLGHFELLKEW